MSAVDSNEVDGNVKIKTKKTKNEPFFTLFDAFFSVFSLCTFIADITTDVIVVVLYIYKEHWAWAGITMTVLVVTSIVIHFFSIRWYVIDGHSSFKICIINFLQLGVIYRYISLLKIGFSLRRNTDPYIIQKFYQKHSDVCMLRLFECFLESAPQIVLQMYIMFSTEDWNPWTGISVAVSLVSLAGGISSYSKSIRNAIPHKERLSWLGLFLQMLWRAGTLASRILAMVLCASALKPWSIMVFGAHWLIMTIWVIFQKTDFCPSWWEEKIYNCVVGVIYCFCFFNLKEGRSRFRVTIFYTIIFLEDICFTFLYYCLIQPSPYFATSFFLAVILSFAVGILSMMIYYCWFHPRGPIFVDSLKSLSFLSDHVSQKGMFLANGLLSLRTLKFSCPEKSSRVPIKMNVSIKGSVESPETMEDSTLPNTTCPSEMGVGLLANIEQNPVLRCWGLEDHSYHSLDCLVLGNVWEENYGSAYLGQGARRNDAKHYRLVNYGFRSQVVGGQMSVSQIHCSCLILYPAKFQNFTKNGLFKSVGKLSELKGENGSVGQSV